MLQSQYRASLAMLLAAIEKCPDALWTSGGRAPLTPYTQAEALECGRRIDAGVAAALDCLDLNAQLLLVPDAEVRASTREPASHPSPLGPTSGPSAACHRPGAWRGRKPCRCRGVRRRLAPGLHLKARTQGLRRWGSSSASASRCPGGVNRPPRPGRNELHGACVLLDLVHGAESAELDSASGAANDPRQFRAVLTLA